MSTLLTFPVFVPVLSLCVPSLAPPVACGAFFACPQVFVCLSLLVFPCLPLPPETRLVCCVALLDFNPRCLIGSKSFICSYDNWTQSNLPTTQFPKLSILLSVWSILGLPSISDCFSGPRTSVIIGVSNMFGSFIVSSCRLKGFKSEGPLSRCGCKC